MARESCAVFAAPLRSPWRNFTLPLSSIVCQFPSEPNFASRFCAVLVCNGSDPRLRSMRTPELPCSSLSWLCAPKIAVSFPPWSWSDAVGLVITIFPSANVSALATRSPPPSLGDNSTRRLSVARFPCALPRFVSAFTFPCARISRGSLPAAVKFMNISACCADK